MRIVLSSLFALAAVAAIGLAEPPAQPAKPAVPVFDGLGKHTRAVATAKPEAQKYFDDKMAFTTGPWSSRTRSSSFKWPRTRLPTGTGEVKRTLFRP